MTYATKLPNGDPVDRTIYNPVLAENQPTFNIITLLRLLLESKAQPSVLPTYFPNKIATDLLVETYAKCAHRIVYDSPSFSTEEQVAQGVREALRQKVRDATGVAIPGTFNKVNCAMRGDWIPIRSDIPVIENGPLPYYAIEVEAADLVSVNPALQLPVQTDAKGKLPKKVAVSKVKSVADTSANWLSQLNTLLKGHIYTRHPDVLTSTMRIVSYAVRSNQRNPQLYPQIVILCTADLSMVLDIYINNERMDVFHYANKGLNQITAPPSVKDDDFSGMITADEYAQYTLGLSLALLNIRSLLQTSRINARKTKVLPEIRK